MYPLLTLTQVLGLSLALVVWAAHSEAKSEKAKAVAEIERLGGKVTVDENSPDKAVIGVDLTNTNVTDAGLAHFKGLTQLQSLILAGTQVTDAGLKHLKGLRQLQAVWLVLDKMTDAGLESLEGLTQLRTLYLNDTKVTNVGLEHLKGLTQLANSRPDEH